MNARARCSLVLSEPSAAEGQLPQFHTVPAAGRYPSIVELPDGKEVHGILVIDDSAFAQILARFQKESTAPQFPGLLVDLEHLSELPAGDSTAAAWVKTMARRDNGLWTGWELTDVGEKLIKNKRFKFRSPVLDLERIDGTENEWRPVRLVSVALTNVPRFKELTPSSLNRGNGEGQEDTTMDARSKNRWVTLDDGRVVPIDEPPLKGSRLRAWRRRNPDAAMPKSLKGQKRGST